MGAVPLLSVGSMIKTQRPRFGSFRRLEKLRDCQSAFLLAAPADPDK
jgi:hypothetical protein